MKTFVGITARHDKQGNIHPLIMHWPDGRDFEVDRVMDVRQAPAIVAGGLGIRYMCRIRNKEVRLYHEENKWFVEH